MNSTYDTYIERLSEISKEVYYGMGTYSQFAIDFIETLESEIESNKESGEVSLESLIGSISYQIWNVLEICDKSIPDFKLFGKLEKIFSSK